MRLDLELSFKDSTVKSILNLFSFDKNALYSAHGIEYIFNKKSFLNFHWERSQRLLTLINSSSAANASHLLRKLWYMRLLWNLKSRVVIQMRSLKEPIWKIWNTWFYNSKYRILMSILALPCSYCEITSICYLKILTKRLPQHNIIKRCY